MTTTSAPGTRRRRWQVAGASVLALVLALVLLVAFFPWDWLRGPFNRYVSRHAGRQFEITRRLDVKLGLTTRVMAQGLVFANPVWARDPWLVQADSAEIQVRLLPLLHGQLELAKVSLERPRLWLELQPDGRRTWALGREGESERSLHLDALSVDRGSVRFVAPHLGADIGADVAIEPGQRLPLRFRAQGRWHGQPFEASGRTGSLLALAREGERPFPLEASGASGASRLRAEGTVMRLADLSGADLALELQGRNLADLYGLSGLVLPATAPYRVEGRLRHAGSSWQFNPVRGHLGKSDVAGAVVFDRGGQVPRLQGELRSRLLDLDDLGPLVGVSAQAAPEAGQGTRAPTGAPDRRPARERPGNRPAREGRVLPDAPLDVARLRHMDADLRFVAERVVHVRQLPLRSLSSRVQLQGGVLRLDPLELGVAGGSVAGWLELDGRPRPATLKLDLQARGVQLGQLLPAVPLNRTSVGELQGHALLSAHGQDLAALLAAASGEVSLLMGPGRISNLLLEFAGLDGAEILKFFMEGDQQVTVRCAAAGFALRQGVMTAHPLVLDTTDTVIWGRGTVDLRNEALDLVFNPYPKDRSILSLRAPLRLGGTLGNPQAGVEKGPLAARAGAALALAAINPLLGLAATVETGPGQDVDCPRVLRQARAPSAAEASPARAPAKGAAASAPSSGRP